MDDEGNLHLADFGFARTVERTGRSRAQTVCGTPYYSAPEVLLGKPYDHKVDVFSFGCLVLELITRRLINVDRIAQRDTDQPCGVDSAGLVKKLPKTIDCPPPLLKLGFVCVEYEPSKRPTMAQAEQIAQQIEKKLGA